LTVFAVDVLTDQRWDDFILRHPCAGVFHSRGWLEALYRTYQCRPALLTSSGPGEPLKDGLLFCEMQSWITGQRMVSLPFSDRCEVLSGDAAGQQKLVAGLRDLADRHRCRYAEIRSSWESEPAAGNWRPSEHFCWHRMALEAPLQQLFSRLHKDCVQRKVRRAEKENLQYENGRSKALLQRFYELLLQTRRRHCLPPQSYQWFQNLMAAMGESLTIRVASKGRRPVAAILTLSYKSTLTYKYGGSDGSLNHYGGMPFLFWKAVQEAKAEGMSAFDLGRSALNNQGLITFKDRLGAQRTELTYWRYSGEKAANTGYPAWLSRAGKQIFRWLPDGLLVNSGKFLYKHFG